MAPVRRTSAFLWRHWTAIRAGTAGVLVLVAIGSCAGQEAQPQVNQIVVAARDIAAGAALTDQDLTVGADSLGLVTRPAAELVGETVRGPVAVGEPVTDSRITPGRSVPAEPGQVVFPLTLGDERIAGLLMAGDRVDVIVTPDSLHAGRARTAAADVEVLTVAAADEGGPGALSRAGSVVLLAVTEAQAAELAAIRRSDQVTVAIG